VPEGGADWPESFSPQQARVPSDFTPQAKNPFPTLTDLNVPEGAVGMAAEEHWFQHAMLPLDLTPQAKDSPELTETKAPDGGDSWSVHSQPPQQTTEPSTRTAHART
jgi:hypothetical protein